MMRPLRSTLSILSISPILSVHCNTCRNSALFAQFELRAQCVRNKSFLGGASNPLYSAFPIRNSVSPPAFSYRVASAYSAKGRRFRRAEDFYSFSGTSFSPTIFTGRPHSGQDAFFISKLDESEAYGAAFGVADGVGGWAESGIDSADFSHALCAKMATIVKGTVQELDTEESRLGPRELLDRAYKKVVEDGDIAGGGSTTCLAIARPDGNLSVANLGDSGFVQIRPGAIHHYSNPQTHAFNTPYQLSIVPPKILALSRAFGGAPLSDMPEVADASSHTVRHGDVLVFATDGVWDNISPDELLRAVTRRMLEVKAWHQNPSGKNGETSEMRAGGRIDALTQAGGMPKIEGAEHHDLQTSLATTIVAEAKAASLNSKRDGPFAKEVQKYYPLEDFHGGKVDDICVVVAVVVGNDGSK